MKTAVTELLGTAFPLLQSGMGGVAGPALAAAVANAGAGGVVALYKSRPDAISALLKATRALTGERFGVNLIPELVTEEELHDQVAAVLASSDDRVFFTFYGVPPPDVCATIRAHGRVNLIQVGTAADARAAASLRADALILQGTEAGGHLLGELSLRALFDAVRSIDLPKIAAGTVGSGRDFHELSSLGFAGCLCGTLFVCAEESDAHDHFKQRVVKAGSDDTVITDLFEIGWPNRRHRVLRNELTARGRGAFGTHFIAAIEVLSKRYAVPRFSSVVPTRWTRGAIEQMVMYCGTSCARVEATEPAARIIARFVADFEAQRGGRPVAESV